MGEVMWLFILDKECNKKLTFSCLHGQPENATLNSLHGKADVMLNARANLSARIATRLSGAQGGRKSNVRLRLVRAGSNICNNRDRRPLQIQTRGWRPVP